MSESRCPHCGGDLARYEHPQAKTVIDMYARQVDQLTAERDHFQAEWQTAVRQCHEREDERYTLRAQRNALVAALQEAECPEPALCKATQGRECPLCRALALLDAPELSEAERKATLSGFGLAELVIEVLDAQKKYFKTRDRDDLIASKQLETKLRREALDILGELPEAERKKLAGEMVDSLRDATK